MGRTRRFDEKLIRRFWVKVDKTPGLGKGDCWLWISAKSIQGYGNFRIGGRINGYCMLAHRLSWLLAGRKIPNDLCVLHKCDNPPCVNPEHLFLGTRRDNAVDREQKRRSVRFVSPQSLVRGESHPAMKFTDAQVHHMISLVAAGNPRREIRELFKISGTHLCNLVSGRRRSGRTFVYTRKEQNEHQKEAEV